MRLLKNLTIACSLLTGLLATLPGSAQTISTVAGSGSPGFAGDNASALSAQIDTVYGIAVDSHGNIYVADSRNNRVRKIANGIITTVAGTGVEGSSGDGLAATSAQLSFPRDVAVDAAGNLYIADTGNSRIRKVTSSGVISNVAGNGTPGYGGDGGLATSAQLSYPSGLATDSAGNLYIADSWNYRVRKITVADGKIQTIAGNGSYGPFGDGSSATAASLGLIQSLAMDTGGNLYLSDTYNHLVRKVAPSGTISAVVGGGFGPAADGGAAQAASLKFPKGIAADTLGNLYIADSLNNRIRKVSPGGTITTIAGSGTPGFLGDSGAATAAQLNSPYGLATGVGGALVLSDLWNYRVRSMGGAPVPPTILGVASTADGQPAIAPGAFASIYGANLAPVTVDWGGSIANRQLPTQISGVSVTVGGKPAYIQYVNSTQINVVVPDLSAGAVPVVVTNAGIASAAFNTTAQVYDPEFFLWGQYAAATHTDYSPCATNGQISGVTTTPAKPGEWVTFWGTGFGPTGAPSGALTPSDKLYLTVPVTVTVGGVNATVYGGTAVASPNYAGLYQIGVQIPASTPNGDVVVRATIGGVQSPDKVLLAVHN
jgi:uncharacterized protein (TIGR03437 family)